jgi:hypothetical protein
MTQHVIGDDRLKTTIGKGQRLRIADDELQGMVTGTQMLLRFLQHASGEIGQGDIPACWEVMLILQPETTRATADFEPTAGRCQAEMRKDPGVEALRIGAVLGMQLNARVKP